MTDFFTKTKTKCKTCILKTKIKEYPLTCELTSPWIERKVNRVLIVLENPLTKDNDQFEKLKTYLDKYLGLPFDIIVGIECETRSGDIPSPLYKNYRSCNTIPENVNYDVIVTLGKSISALTKTEDLPSWEEFVEFQFNPTYFYTSFQFKNKIRVYPLPYLDLFLGKDNFENMYAKIQLKKVKEYVENVIDLKTKPEYFVNKIEDPNQFLLDHLKDEVPVALDTETSGLNVFDKNFQVRCITLSFDGITGYYLPFEKIDLELLSQFLKNKKQLWANGKYDCKVLIRQGVKNLKIDEDVILLFHLLSTERRKNSIKSLAWLIGFGNYDKELSDFVENTGIKNYCKIPEKYLLNYSTLDAIVTYRLWVLGKQLARKQPGAFNAYQIIIKATEVFMKMELNGININHKILNTIDRRLSKLSQKIQEHIQKEIGKKFQLGSPEQLGKQLEDMGWPELGRTIKGIYNTGDIPLQKWKKMGYKLADTILRYRSIEKLRTSFIGSVETKSESNLDFFDLSEDNSFKEEGLAKFICPDGKIHPIFGPGRTDSLRSTCGGPNSQQFPNKLTEGKLFERTLDVPDDNFVKFKLDFSGMQMRIGGIFANDENLIKTYKELGGDVHSMTACVVYCKGMPIEEFIKLKKKEPYKTYRFRSKFVNFGFLFGSASKSFAQRLQNEWTDKDLQDYIELVNPPVIEGKDNWYRAADDIRNKFFGLWNKLPAWFESYHELAKKQGYIDTIKGGRRHLPYLMYRGKDTDLKKYYNLLNIAVNSPVQGFEALTVYECMFKIQKEIDDKKLKSYLTNMVHDSLEGYVHKNEIDVMKQILLSIQDFETYSIPLEVELEIEK